MGQETEERRKSIIGKNKTQGERQPTLPMVFKLKIKTASDFFCWFFFFKLLPKSKNNLSYEKTDFFTWQTMSVGLISSGGTI